jgi:hypothetical protein
MNQFEGIYRGWELRYYSEKQRGIGTLIIILVLTLEMNKFD